MIDIIKQCNQKIITCLVMMLLFIPVWVQMHPTQKPESETVTLSQEENLWKHIQQGIGTTLAEYPAVVEQIQTYQTYPQSLETSLERAAPYLYHIVSELEKRQLPLAFALLPVVESAYDPQALSHAGALGLWQLMPATADMYGVPKNGLYDGRLDLIASTDAALDYLSYLGELFQNDWLLVIAAYNTGEGNVLRAIRENEALGLPTDFWSLDLPKETQLHVPKLLAVAELVSQPIRYGIQLPHTPSTPLIDYVELDEQIDLALAARLANIPLEELSAINPGYKQRKQSANGPHRLFLPMGRADDFEKRLSSL